MSQPNSVTFHEEVHLDSLFFQIVRHGGDYADALHQATVWGDISLSGFVGVAARIRWGNRENTP